MTTLISFYTNDWKYPKYAEMLRNQCDEFNIPYVIEELKSTKSYLKNTCLKPQFILDKLKELKSPILWVDVDACILKRPDCFDFEINGDFAAKRMSPDRNRTWHVGTLYFGYNENTLEFIEKWINNTGNLSDESSLEVTWNQYGYLLNDCELTREYFYIQRKKLEPPEGTFIMHRISTSIMKKREMGIAKTKRDSGVY